MPKCVFISLLSWKARFVNNTIPYCTLLSVLWRHIPLTPGIHCWESLVSLCNNLSFFSGCFQDLFSLRILQLHCLCVGFFYLSCRNLVDFPKPRIGVIHRFWKILSHYLFKCCLPYSPTASFWINFLSFGSLIPS